MHKWILFHSLQDETPREVVVKGSPVQVRTVTLQDKEDRVKLALWRKLADENIKAGDYVNVSNVLITSYQDHVELASTSRTKVEVHKPIMSQKFYLLLPNVAQLSPSL